MKNWKPSTLTWLLLGSLLVPMATASAQLDDRATDSWDHLGQTSTAADLVLHGQVVDVVYAMSTPTEMEPTGVPHTFVTYRVDRVFRGHYQERELTLRFLGGWDEAAESFLGTNLTPRFDLGDEDVLFVRDNGTSACPLVGNYRGRLRIIDGQVYNDNGHALRFASDGAVEIGGRYDLPEVTTTYILGEGLRSNVDPQALRRPSQAAAASELIGLLESVASGLPGPQRIFESADSSKSFAIPDFTPVVARESIPAEASP